MDVARPSATAMMVAVSRDAHRVYDGPPWILDDPYARVLVGPGWSDIRASSEAMFSEPARRQVRAALVVRSRYAEDRLVTGPYRQYIILGAGLDSFAWRRPDLVGPLRVFEVDHPATQLWKRARVGDLGLPVREGHVFAPVDFETEALQSSLERAGLDWSLPTFFSWLGVTMYLTTEAIDATLGTVAACEPESEIVLTYDDSDSVDEIGRQFVEAESKVVASVGEPYTAQFSPGEAEALVERCGLEVAEHPTPDILYERYFSDRHDGLRPFRASASSQPGCPAEPSDILVSAAQAVSGASAPLVQAVLCSAPDRAGSRTRTERHAYSRSRRQDRHSRTGVRRRVNGGT